MSIIETPVGFLVASGQEIVFASPTMTGAAIYVYIHRFMAHELCEREHVPLGAKSFQVH